MRISSKLPAVIISLVCPAFALASPQPDPKPVSPEEMLMQAQHGLQCMLPSPHRGLKPAKSASAEEKLRPLFAEYQRRIRRILGEEKEVSMLPVSCTFQFERNGHISELMILKSSGSRPFDQLFLNSVKTVTLPPPSAENFDLVKSRGLQAEISIDPYFNVRVNLAPEKN